MQLMAKAKSIKSRGIMATREAKSDWAERKAGRMLMDSSAHQKKTAGRGKRPPMATKNPEDRRAATGSRNRKLPSTTQAERGQNLRTHFKNILSGKAGRMQGKK
jgi:hypothetical protein